MIVQVRTGWPQTTETFRDDMEQNSTSINMFTLLWNRTFYTLYILKKKSVNYAWRAKSQFYNKSFKGFIRESDSLNTSESPRRAVVAAYCMWIVSSSTRHEELIVWRTQDVWGGHVDMIEGNEGKNKSRRHKLTQLMLESSIVQDSPIHTSNAVLGTKSCSKLLFAWPSLEYMQE